MSRSTKIIAALGVVAGLGVAVAPLSVFAAPAAEASDSHTDELVITLEPTCTFGDALAETPIAGVSHTAVDGTTWNESKPTTDETDAPKTHSNDDVASTGYGIKAGEGATIASNVNASEHTAYRTMQAGTTNDDFAKTTLKVVCTNTDGYTVKAATADLAREGETTVKIPAAATYSTSASGYNIASITATNGVDDASDVVSGKGSKFFSADPIAIVEHAGISKTAGDSIDIVYGIGIQSNQKAGTYAGKVVYTLFQGK